MRFHRPYTSAEIAERLGMRVQGPKDAEITGLNDTHIVSPGEVCFADHPRYLSKALKSEAAAIIVREGLFPVGASSKVFFTASDPFEAFVELIRMVQEDARNSGHLGAPPQVHPTARVAEGVHLGNDVTVGPGTVIHPHVVIYNNCHIGAHCVIHSGSIIGADAFYFRRRGNTGLDKFISCGRVILEDHVEVGALCTIDRGVTGDTRLGAHTKLDDQVHIGHDVSVGQRVLMAAQCGIAGFCVLEDDVVLWGQVGVTKEVRIGAGAQVLARSGVMNHLEPGKKYFGNPAVEAFQKHREIILRQRLSEVFKKLGI